MVGDWLHRLRPEPAPAVAYMTALLGTGAAGVLTALMVSVGLVGNRRTTFYLLPVLYVGARWGTGPATVGALCAVAFHEAYFYAFDATPLPTATELLELTLLFVAGLVTGALAARARAEAGRARDSELRATLLASISHDVRTPLTAIKATLASLRGGTLAPPERDRLIDHAEAEVDRLAQLATNTLTLARLRAGPGPTLEWNAVGELLFAAVDRCAGLLDGRSVSVDAPDTLPLVRIDAGLFDQAVSNLLENAALHTPPGTPVRLRASVGANELRLEIEDDGPGLPAADRVRVLREFERASGDHVRGVGLGLAIARAVAEAHGGRLRLDDARSGGLRVVLLFPGAASA